MRILKIFISLFCILCLARPASAAIEDPALQVLQDSMKNLERNMTEMRNMIQSQNQLIQQQAAQITALERGVSAGPRVIPGSSAQAPVGAPAIAGVSQGFNPEIGVTSVIQGNLTEDSTDGEGKDTIAMKELELNLASYVDPYSRLDAIIAFNDNLEEQNVDIEEAYYSHWGLPFGFKGQIGKFRAKIGKENLQHLHALDAAEYSLVTRDFFGDEGLSSSGARLVNYIPNPWDIPLEVTGEVFRGNNGNSFSGISRRPIFNTHLKTYFDTSENSNLELGWTTLFGDENPVVTELVDDGTGTGTLVEVAVDRPQGSGHYGVKVFGADATWKWMLPENKVFKWQNEIYFQNRGTTRHVNDTPWGFYTLGDYRFSKRFSAGLRFDYLEPLDVVGAHNNSIAVSPYIVFWQSEFADFRLQYTHFQPAGADPKENNELILKANILIGAHKHPVQ